MACANGSLAVMKSVPVFNVQVNPYAFYDQLFKQTHDDEFFEATKIKNFSASIATLTFMVCHCECKY
jgi:hypothetical protein